VVASGSESHKELMANVLGVEQIPN